MKKKLPRMPTPRGKGPAELSLKRDGESAGEDSGPMEALGVPFNGESSLLALIDSLPVGILITNTEGKILGANQTFLDMSGGYSIEELLEIPVTNLYVNPEDRKGIIEALMHDSWIRDFETEVNIKGGTTLWIAISSVVHTTFDGERIIISALQDIDERKMAERNLRLSQYISDNAQELIVRISRDGKILYANDAACRLHGYANEEMLGLSIWDIDADVFQESWPERWRDRKEKKWVFREAEGIRRDGTRYPLEITSSFFEFEGEEYLVVLGRDITQRKMAEEAQRDSEILHRTLVDISTDVIVVMDGLGRIQEVSGNALKLYGAGDIEDLVGTNGFDLLAPDDRVRALEHFAENVKSGVPTRGEEFVAIRRDGTSLPLEVSVDVVKDASGAPQSIVAALKDISGRRKWEEELKKSEAKYRFLTENMNDLVWTLDQELKTTYVSPAIEKVLGYTTEERIGKTPRDQLTQESLLMVARLMAEEIPRDDNPGVDPDRTFFLELEYVHKNGSVVCLETIVSIIRDEDGNPTGIYGVSRDITERKKYEEELEKKNAELKGFAHTVSHDLRGPLAALVGANKTLRLLLKDPDVGDFRSDILEMTDIIDSSAVRAERLITDVLSLAETGQVPHEVSQVNISEVVQRIFSESSKEIEERLIDVRMDDDLGTVIANPTHVYQIFSNLIGNAVKHNDNARPCIEVLSFERGRAGHGYIVRDNGSGIPDEDVERIFIPFFKGTPGSTGIGLSTVERILEVYDGGIKAYNDGGACFEFTINDFRET